MITEREKDQIKEHLAELKYSKFTWLQIVDAFNEAPPEFAQAYIEAKETNDQAEAGRQAKNIEMAYARKLVTDEDVEEAAKERERELRIAV